MCLGYNPTGEQFATAGKDCVVRIYDPNTQQVIQQLKGDGYGA